MTQERVPGPTKNSLSSDIHPFNLKSFHKMLVCQWWCGVCVDVGAPTSVRRLKTTQQLPAAGTGKRSLQRVALAGSGLVRLLTGLGEQKHWREQNIS